MTLLIALGIAGVVLTTIALVMTLVNLTVYERPGDASAPRPGATEPRVSVCVPARNEQANLAGCVRSVLGAADGLDVEVLIYDDQSTDANPDLVALFREQNEILRQHAAIIAAQTAALGGTPVAGEPPALPGGIG